MKSSPARLLFFFFSSRRRHTRFDCDWSSDVCSSDLKPESSPPPPASPGTPPAGNPGATPRGTRSEEHTSELQSQSNLVCRLLLEKKNKSYYYNHSTNSTCRYIVPLQRTL